ncbi:unnamed protein product [Caenorhabditis bovis]|uniref:G-protein coupled receptors family 1 profile domain-containing protein n=1 Tax=Caenorhabditis bovis TaxID=2654633 RepID=A0A8S1END1_9PELO|nr:unnamed protein product [Caenorhabditis bovis]
MDSFSGLSEDNPPGMAHVDYIAHVIVMPIVLSVGMMNQCLNVCTLLHLPAGCFMYLKASAIADILSIISFVPFLVRNAELHDQTWYFGMMYHAHIELPLINALIAASAMNIVAMTVDRYLSVCHPIKFFHTNESKFRSIMIILSLYLTSILIYVPSIWQKKVVPQYSKELERNIWVIERNNEYEEMHYFKVYLFIREAVCRWGPVIVLVVLNTAMIRKLRKLEERQSKWGRSSRIGRGGRMSGRSNRSASTDRGRISTLLLVTSTTFVICNLPASFLSIFIRLVDNSLFWQIFRSIANLLQVTSYLYNFYLYALCSSEYREALFRLLGCKKTTSPISTGDSPTVRLSGNIRRGTVVDFENRHAKTVPMAEV